MDKDQLAQRLMATFLEELHDHVGNINRELLALEKGPSNDERLELLKVLFRSAHSLKGAARAVSVDVLEAACHRMEDLFSELRDGQRDLTPSLASLLLKTVDAIEEVGMRLRSEQDLDDSPLQALIPDLDRLIEAGRDESQEESISGDSAVDTRPETATTAQQDEDISQSEPAPHVGPMHRGHVPAAAEASAASQSVPATAVSRSAPTGQTIRVPAEKLDSLLAQSSELLIARRRVEFRSSDAAELCEAAVALRNEWRELEQPLRKLCQRPTQDGELTQHNLPRRSALLIERTAENITGLTRRLDQLASNMRIDSRLLGQTCEALDGEVYRVRMLPFAEACGGLERAVRDLSRTTGKQVELVLDGVDVEIDRSVLEGLKDPLLHLVRNAVDHGIESPDQRVAAGKSTAARVTVSAALRGGQVEVTVADDGQGFDLARIRNKAEQQGLAVPEKDEEIARLVFAAGFSTAPIVTDVSGRGVGLDVVQNQIESLHGVVDVSFRAGEGTCFSLTVPLTLTTIRSVLADAAGQTFAIPTVSVHQIIRFSASDVHSIGGRDMLLMGGTPTPIVPLATTLGLPMTTHSPADQQDTSILAIVLSSGEQRAAVVVDAVTSEQEVLVKNLGVRIRRVRNVSGATLLPSGNVALVLNVPNLIRTAFGQPATPWIGPANSTDRSAPHLRVLAVDDSMTTRTLLKSILEVAGFDVTVAVDGQHAWELIQADKFDVIVSDVDMPRMNGFQLTSRIRSRAPSAELPVVLVTARGNDEDKAQGIKVGASAYIVKSGFDQGNLLEVIRQLI